MMNSIRSCFVTLFLAGAVLGLGPAAGAGVGVGARPLAGAELILDGTRKLLDENWTYWEGPRFSSALRIKSNQMISQVWGGANSGIDGGNDGGKGITDTPGGLKLQCEGHDVRYRNIWIKELDIKQADTDFNE